MSLIQALHSQSLQGVTSNIIAKSFQPATLAALMLLVVYKQMVVVAYTILQFSDLIQPTFSKNSLHYAHGDLSSEIIILSLCRFIAPIILSLHKMPSMQKILDSQSILSCPSQL